MGAQVRPTYREGWAVSPLTEQTVTFTTESYRMGSQTFTYWQESQQIVTPTGELQYHKRSKPKQTSWRWTRSWTEPASQYTIVPDLPAIVQELAAIAAYIRTQYGVSVPKFDAPS